MRSISRSIARLAAAPHSSEERPDVERCEALRARLIQSEEPIGDVFESTGGGLRTTVGAEAQSASVPAATALLLYRLVRRCRPANVVELGAALGVSGAYVACALRANGGGRLHSIEGSQSRATIAAQSIEAVAPGFAEIRQGFFDDHLDAFDGADFVFIDGNHQPEPTRRYIEQAAARCARPCLLVLDDVVAWPELHDVWHDYRRDTRFTRSGQHAGLGFLALGKPPKLGSGARRWSGRRWRSAIAR